MTTFFKWLWRFNAFGIATALIFGGLIVAWGLYNMATHRHVHNVIEAHESASPKDNYKLGELQTWAKSSYGLIPLYLNQQIEESYYSKSSAGNIVNYLFVHLPDGKIHWLFAHSHYLILRMMPLNSEPGKLPPTEPVYDDDYRKECPVPKEAPIPSKVLLYELVKASSDKSQKLTAKDPKTVALSHLDGSNYTEVLSNITTLYGAQLTPHDDILIIYDDQEGFHTALVQKDTFTIKHQTLVPPHT